MIEGAIETSATSSDPSKCSEVQTQSFNETETGKTGKASLEACEEETPEEEGELAESVTVSSIEVEGEEGAAAVAVEGGSLGGQTIAAGLQKEGEDWKVDSFFAFIKYDPASLRRGPGRNAGRTRRRQPRTRGLRRRRGRRNDRRRSRIVGLRKGKRRLRRNPRCLPGNRRKGPGDPPSRVRTLPRYPRESANALGGSAGLARRPGTPPRSRRPWSPRGRDLSPETAPISTGSSPSLRCDRDVPGETRTTAGPLDLLDLVVEPHPDRPAATM